MNEQPELVGRINLYKFFHNQASEFGKENMKTSIFEILLVSASLPESQWEKKQNMEGRIKFQL
jgi:hypothetical protein